MKNRIFFLILTFLCLSCDKKLSQNEQIENEQKIEIEKLFEDVKNESTFGQIEIYSKILNIQSNNIDALGNRATLYMNEKEFEKAIVDYTDLINEYERLENVGFLSVNYLARAKCKFELGDYQGSLNDLDETEKYNKDFQDLYVYRAYSYLKLGDKENACKNFSIAGEKGYEEAYDEIKQNCN